MKIELLNGLYEDINLKKYMIKKDGYCKSKFQEEIRNQLIKKYPNDTICEEVYIKGENFFLDFFIPSLGLVVEANGDQHKKHIKFFHKTKREFNEQLDKDQRKRNWCVLNNFKIIEIYNE
jgi:hypothetical protein